MSAFEWLSLVGNLASIAGLIVSLLVLWGVRRIRLHFLLRARIPEIMKDLEDRADRFSKLLKEFESQRNQCKNEMSICQPVLHNLRDKLPRQSRTEVDSLLSTIKRVRGHGIVVSKDTAWEFYTDLQALIESVKQFEQDTKWSH